MLATNNSRYFKILLDCSKFSSTCDIPVPWITEFFDVIPFDQLSQLVALEILNPNRMAQGFLRKARHLFMGTPIRSQPHAVFTCRFRILYTHCYYRRNSISIGEFPGTTP